MAWYILAQQLNEEFVTKKIKSILLKHPFFNHLMNEYHIPLKDIQTNLIIRFDNLEGKFAEGNGKEIKLDKSLLDGNFFKENFHFVVHEFFHWIKRRSEQLFYFNDDEEIQSVALAIAWEMLSGKSMPEIEKSIYPIIAGHYERKIDAKQMFLKIVNEANKILDAHNKKV